MNELKEYTEKILNTMINMVMSIGMLGNCK